ncbi:MAG: autotransporter outer membrane beta-barrel domain-containing protein [Parasutterella excrementihominis]
MESFLQARLTSQKVPTLPQLNIARGGVAGALTAEVAKDGSMLVKEAQNTVNSSLIDIVASNFLFFRSQMNDVSARLGDLRSMPKTAGAWVRYYGGKNKYSSGNMSEKYNTVQLGGDGFINDTFYLGGTFSYTHGDGNLRNGSTDDKNFNFGIYGGWLGDSVQFVDVIIKRHRVSDFSLYNTMGRNSGSFHNWGTSASVEARLRLQVPDTDFYVEPQAELQFGRLDSVDYKTNKGVKVEQDGIDSFVGRRCCCRLHLPRKNKGNAYAKASVLHDWKGEVKSTFSSNGAKRTYRDDLGGTWGEFAVGGTFNPTKNISAYGQVKTSAGSLSAIRGRSASA